MKKVIFIDDTLEDPGVSCSSREFHRYRDNKAITDSLNEEGHEVHLHLDLWKFTDEAIAGNKVYDFIISNMPYELNDNYKEISNSIFAKYENPFYAFFKCEENRYARSFECFDKIKSEFPETKIIAYTGAEPYIASRSFQHGVDYVVLLRYAHNGKDVFEIRGFINGRVYNPSWKCNTDIPEVLRNLDEFDKNSGMLKAAQH